MNKLLIAIPILVIIAVISWSLVTLIDVNAEINNCKIWITMNTMLTNEEYRNDLIGFSDYPNTTHEEFFKIRFHANFYECDRWWNYDQVLDDILNERIDDQYFDDMYWRSEK